MLPAGNGQGPRHHLLQQCSIALLFQPALTSPFIEFQYTAFSPSAALWDIFLQLLLSFIGFSLSIYSYEVYSSRFRLSTLFHLEFSSKITISWLTPMHLESRLPHFSRSRASPNGNASIPALARALREKTWVPGLSENRVLLSLVSQRVISPITVFLIL